jgi:hypothetical protein
MKKSKKPTPLVRSDYAKKMAFNEDLYPGNKIIANRFALRHD